jgi:hypothetical protein
MSEPGGDLESLLDAAADPEVAREAIAALHARIREQQASSEALRAENVLLKRAGHVGVSLEAVQRLKADYRELRDFARKGGLDQDVLALVSANGQSVLLPEPAALEQTLTVDMGTASARDLRPLHLVPGMRLGSWIALSSAFRLLALPGLALPVSDEMRWHESLLPGALGLPRGEQIEALCALPDTPPRQLMIVTRQGWVRAMAWSSAENVIASGQALTAGNKGDVPVWLGPADGGDLLLLTRLGRWVRFPIATLEPSGQRAISLEPDDDVACAAVLPTGDATLCAVAADGSIVVVQAAALPAHKNPGAKSQAFVRNWISLATFVTQRNDALVLFGSNGELTVSTLRGLPIASRLSDARPLNVAGQRVLAATRVGR